MIAIGIVGAGASATTIAVATGIVSIGLSFALSAVTNALFGKPKFDAPTFTAVERDRTTIIRATIEPRRIIYGTAKVSGPLVFASSTGARNEFLHLVVALAGHEVEEIGDVYLNDTLATDARFSGYVRINLHLGSDDQSADPDLVAEVPEWTSAHRLRGVAYLYVRLRYNPDVYPTGIPNISAVVKGRKVLDPRTDTVAWSNNAALCLYDYIRDTRFGLGAGADELDNNSWIAAANICDEQVEISDDSPPLTQARYTCDGVVYLDDTPAEIAENLLTAMAGSIVYTQGRYRLYPGAYRVPTITLDESDLRGPIAVRPRVERRALFNAVRGTFVDPEQFWQPTDFPPVRNPAYVTQDGGEEIFRDIQLPYTADAIRAQRLAKIHLEKSRQGITVEFPAKITALPVEVDQPIMLSIDRLGWASKVFLPTQWTLQPDGVIGLALQEEAAEVYDWALGNATVVDPAPDTNLPRPWEVPPPSGIVLTSGTSALYLKKDGTVVSRIRVRFTAAPSDFVVSHEVQFRVVGADDWETVPRLPVPQVETLIWDVQDGVLHEVRVRAETVLGARSPFVVSAPHEVVGKTEPPPNVTGFRISGDTVSWDAISRAAVPDLAGYVLAFHYGINDAFGTAAPLHSGVVTENIFTMSPRPAGPVTLLVKAIDTSGNISVVPARIFADLGDPVVANVVETFDQDPDWPGVLTNGQIDGGELVADDSGDLIWSSNPATPKWSFLGALYWQGLFEDMVYEWQILVTEALAGSAMTLLFDAVGPSVTISWRPNAPVLAWLDDPDALYWADDADGLWITPDFAPWPGTAFPINDLYDFRLSTGGGTPQGVVSTLAVVIDAPDIEETIEDFALDAAGDRLPIVKHYARIKVVNLTIQQDGGDAVTIKSIDKSAALGPLVRAFDVAGIGAAAVVDARIQGY